MKDLNIYNLRMVAAMQDKLFFVNKIDLKEYDLIVDFGCATGELLRSLMPFVCQPGGKHVQMVGFDTNEDMISIARHNVLGEFENIEVDLCTNFDSLLWHLDDPHKKSLIIFSSVLHEIPDHEQRKIMNTIMPKFTTVVIRDMKRPSNNEPISNITRKRVLAQVAPWQVQMFESRWGKIRDKENLYRFFLMNEFVENFETEVEEDYFSVLWTDIHWRLEKDYDLAYECSFLLPYRKQQVKKRFSHVMHDITHRKVIYTRKAKQYEEKTSLSN